MANEEQLSILKQGVEVWNMWRADNPTAKIDLSNVNLTRVNLARANLVNANLALANLSGVDLGGTDLMFAKLVLAFLTGSSLTETYMRRTILSGASLTKANLNGVNLVRCDFRNAIVGDTIFRNLDMSEAIGLDEVHHNRPSFISTDTFVRSKGKISESFLRGCGLPDWEIESTKLHNPDLTNEEISEIQYKVYELRATQAIQISPLFISYSHADSIFVDKVESHLNKKGVRFWRDIHDMKSGRMEKQIDRAMRLNPTVLLILSEHSLKSDWVEHEVRSARSLEKELKRDVLCPVALDDGWKNSSWAKRIMEQIMEYNILDFSEWKDDTKFESTFNKLIDGLELFYK